MKDTAEEERYGTHGKSDVPQTHALEEAREAVVVPVPLARLLRAGLRKRGEQRAHGREHVLLDDVPWRVRDREEHI